MSEGKNIIFSLQGVSKVYPPRKTVLKNIYLSFFYGVGGHVGVWDDRNQRVWFEEDQNFNQVIVGFDGILGLNYDFQEVPINLSLDWKPEVNLASYRGVWVGDIALSVRYYWK